jgi:GLPGLI family protein
MKNIFLVFSLITFSLFNNLAFAQKGFEGAIIYGIEYEDLPEEMEAMKAMLPSETTIKIKGSKTRTEQSMGMGSTTSIMDGKNNSLITLMDMMGNKVAIRNDLNKEEKDNAAEVVNIDYIDETKEIAGYKCKKAEIKIEDQEDVIVVYYTEEINTVDTKSQYKGLKGFPMSYEINTPEMKMIMTVKEVKKGKISAEEFTIPEAYEEMTMEEFQKSMGAQMGGE